MNIPYVIQSICRKCYRCSIWIILFQNNNTSISIWHPDSLVLKLVCLKIKASFKFLKFTSLHLHEISFWDILFRVWGTHHEVGIWLSHLPFPLHWCVFYKRFWNAMLIIVKTWFSNKILKLLVSEIHLSPWHQISSFFYF